MLRENLREAFSVTFSSSSSPNVNQSIADNTGYDEIRQTFLPSQLSPYVQGPLVRVVVVLHDEESVVGDEGGRGHGQDVGVATADPGDLGKELTLTLEK